MSHEKIGTDERTKFVLLTPLIIWNKNVCWTFESGSNFKQSGDRIRCSSYARVVCCYFFLISLFLPAIIMSLSLFTLYLFELSLHVHAIYFIDITDVSLKSFFSLSFLHSLALHVHRIYVQFIIFACGCRFILMQIAWQ